MYVAFISPSFNEEVKHTSVIKAIEPKKKRCKNRNLHMGQLPRHNQPIITHHRPSCDDDALLAIGRQWDIGPARVPTVEGPFRLAMADDEDPRCRHVCD